MSCTPTRSYSRQQTKIKHSNSCSPWRRDWSEVKRLLFHELGDAEPTVSVPGFLTLLHNVLTHLRVEELFFFFLYIHTHYVLELLFIFFLVKVIYFVVKQKMPSCVAIGSEQKTLLLNLHCERSSVQNARNLHLKELVTRAHDFLVTRLPVNMPPVAQQNATPTKFSYHLATSPGPIRVQCSRGRQTAPAISLAHILVCETIAAWVFCVSFCYYARHTCINDTRLASARTASLYDGNGSCCVMVRYYVTGS